MLCCVVLRCTALCCVVLRCVVLCCVVLSCVVLSCVVGHTEFKTYALRIYRQRKVFIVKDTHGVLSQWNSYP